MKTTTLILGGSKGLGQALVNQAQKAGHQVHEFSRSGSGDVHMPCDLAQLDSSAIKACFESIQTDRIHLVINAAVLAPFGHLAEQQASEIAQHIDINIQGTVQFLQAFVGQFQSLPGDKSITYLSSGAAQRAIPGLALYSASKAFFERYIDTLAEEQKAWSNPFRCITVNPGVMQTEMQAEIRAQSAHDFPMVDWWQTLYQEGKLADPSDIADVCLNLIEQRQSGYFVAQELLAQK